MFVRRNGRTIRANPRGTYAQTGGIDGRQLVMQVTKGGRSRLALYGLATHKLRFLPPYINDGAWLWRPDIDGHRILYGAIVPGSAAVLSYEIRIADLDRHTVRTLARLDGHAEYAAPGQLQGDWATWVSCPESTCNVRRENLATGITDSPPEPNHLVYTQLGPAVNRSGVVYYERTLGQCGQTEIRRWNGHADSLVTRLPTDSAYQYAYLAKDTHPSLYFDLVGCSRTARSDIYAIPVSMGG